MEHRNSCTKDDIELVVYCNHCDQIEYIQDFPCLEELKKIKAGLENLIGATNKNK